MEYRSAEQEAAARRMIGGSDPCMGPNDLTLAMPPPLFVGAVAEHLIGELYPERDSGPVPPPAEQQQQGDGLARNEYEDFALCVVARDRRAVRAWLRAAPASDEETGAVARVAPHLSPCLRTGVSIEFNRSTLRALLAAGLYRALSSGPRGSAGNW